MRRTRELLEDLLQVQRAILEAQRATWSTLQDISKGTPHRLVLDGDRCPRYMIDQDGSSGKIRRRKPDGTYGDYIWFSGYLGASAQKEARRVARLLNEHEEET